jgi:hypothetical protein
MRLRLIVLAGVALLAMAATAGSQTRAQGQWTGTVRIVENFSFTFSQAAPGGGVITEVRTGSDDAVYTLTGETTPDGFGVASMTGSGSFRSVGSSTDPNVCVESYDPLGEWSYTGPARVRISYADGRFLVEPQLVDVTARSVATTCSPGKTQTNTIQAPFGLRQNTPPGIASPEGATVLQRAVPFTLAVAGSTANTSSATLTVDLRRGGPSITPIGTASGTVLVNGKPYTSGQPIPYGSKVDVTNGRLKLRTDVGTLTVYGGGVSAVFKLLRLAEQGRPVVELRLLGGDFSICKPALRGLAAPDKKKPPGKTVRRLWAKGSGQYRTRGRYASAAIRGTFWLTSDRCDGTLTSVRQGRVEVFDFVKKIRVTVPAGKSYLAQPRR